MHYMKLFDDPYKRIKSGEKNIEFRLNDEKRQRVKIGDYITFKNIDTGEEVVVECTALYRAGTFKELFENLYVDSKMRIKQEKSPEELSKKMREYYSIENERKYGTLGIEIKLVDDEECK